MNKKLVLTGKAVLSTVMASTMACSMLSTNILAQEPEVAPEEETTVEKTPVEEETTATEEPTETPEEATGGNEETTLNDTTTVNEVADSPVVLAESSLKQSTNYPKPEYEQYTVEELKSMLSEKINEVKNLWETNGGYDYYKNNQSIKTVLNNLAKAEEYLAEGNSTAMTFSWRVYEMTNAVTTLTSDANILTEIDKKIYELNKEKESLNEADYTAESWKAYADKLSEAMTTVNGSGTSEETKQQYYDEIVALKNALVKVDQNLTALKQLVSESETIINSQLDTDTQVSYTKESWVTFSKAYTAAFEEVNKNLETIDKDLFDKLYNDLLNAKNSLEEAEKVEGEETGVLDEWTEKKVGESTKIRGGQLYVSNETTNNDGTTTITVTWVNDGTYPLTGGYFHNTNTTTSGKFGGEYTLRPYKESDFKRAGDPFIDVHYTDLNGEHKTISEDLTVDAVVDGFVKEFTVPTGSSISLEISNWGNDFYSYSLGTYYTKNVVAADKTAPTVELSYEMTEEGVKVTLTADEAIQSIDGWTKVSDTQYQRVYAGAVDETITVYDLAGNKAEVQLTLADKTALKEAIENFGNLEGSGKVYDNYVKVLNDGKALLENPEATQVKVDNAARNIETCYYKVLVAALNTKYNPDTFDYSKYTTDSIIPVQHMYGITHNRTNDSYQENEAQGNIGQMKGWYEEYLKAEAGLTLAAQDEKYIGLNKDAVSSSSKKQGNFNVIKQEIVNVDGTYKIQLTMEFINDGLHPIYGSELPNANGSTKFSKFSFGESDAKKARVHTYDSKMGASRYVTWQNVSKLDGQDSWSKGFKGTIILEPDEEYVTFEFKKGISDVAYSPWYYHVQPMDTTAPEVVKIVPNQDGTILVKFSEPVTINDPEWKESENPYEQGGQYWIGTLTEDKIYTVVATDTAGIGVEFTVDHKDPVGNVTYQENEDGTVTVTIAFDERITVNSSTQNPGWTYNEDFTAISKTFDKNAQEQVTVHDNMDNETVVEVNVDSFDETAPEYTVTYSNDGNPTNQDVTVTITANEPLQEVEGWTLSDDGLSLTKTYSENKEETVVIADASGNTSEVPVNVTGIDKLGPTVTVKNETTEDGVLVTIETNEPIQTPDGWTKVSDTKYTKLYTENTSEDIIVYDLAGNATKAHVTVSSISKPGTGGSDQDKNQGTDTKKEDSKKTDGTNTGVFVGTGLFAGSATAAAAGASLLAFLKKRKK